MMKKNKPQPAKWTNRSQPRGTHISCHVAHTSAASPLPHGATSAATCTPTSAACVANAVWLTDGPASYDEKATTSMTKLVHH